MLVVLRRLWHPFPRLLFALTASLLIGGCAPHPSVSVPPIAPRANSGRILLTLSPLVPRALDRVTFTVRVTDTQGRPVPDAKVKADLTMPDMAMPPNSFPLLMAAPGTYTGQGRFTMPDKWAVTVSVKDKGKQTTQTFPIAVR